jgi:hypothetical protein
VSGCVPARTSFAPHRAAPRAGCTRWCCWRCCVTRRRPRPASRWPLHRADLRSAR